ncbi:YdcH family protein [Sphingomonas sp. Leaf339]|uniref:YdcH family protein n=1 Tax=Sphingomonas sp. Leaf339 TaxID=1736343 RepID=UPI0039DFCF10
MATIRESRVLLTPPQGTKETLPMQSTAHQIALETKHATIDRRIADETGRPHPDTAMLADLKKQKLRLKEEIVSL